MPIKRFIAGAVCQQCSAQDKVRAWEDEDERVMRRECVLSEWKLVCGNAQGGVLEPDLSGGTSKHEPEESNGGRWTENRPCVPNDDLVKYSFRGGR